MDLLIKAATIVDPNSSYHNQVRDILIVDGSIAKIEERIEADDIAIFQANNLHVSPGWFDLHANFRDPGHEYKEDLQSGMAAAAAGGYTGVTVMPSTTPPVDSKSAVEYLVNKAASGIVDVYPTGTLSDRLKGKEMSEMYDMKCAGAVAFTDDKTAVANPGLMSRALLYTKNFNGLTIAFANDDSMMSHGQVNEGAMSTKMGLHGIPSLAEELQLARDIYLTNYNEGRVHFCTLSSANSVDLIRTAKAKGMAITAEVAAHQLLLDDSRIEDFDTNYKVLPPLRTQHDIEALKEGLKDGTIDVISSDHTPEDITEKEVEFENAAFGISSLETTFATANTALRETLNTEQIVEKMALNPRKILGLETPVVDEGHAANLTFFDPALAWTVDRETWQSKSQNNPFFGQTLIGKALGIYNKGRYQLS